MPVLESTDEITPRSVLRHRPIGDKTAKTGKESVIPSTSTTPVAQRASRLRPKNTDVAEDISEWQREETDETRTGRKTAVPRQAEILVWSTSFTLPGCWYDRDASFMDIAHFSDKLVEHYVG